MGWSNEEEFSSNKKNGDMSSKLLLAIIACVVLIIILILVLLMNISKTSFTIKLDEKLVSNVQSSELIIKEDNINYINIEKFAEIVGYEYHDGEYKTFTIEQGKCYAKGQEETASFFENENKVYKLPVDRLTEDYRVYTVENEIKTFNNKMYAPVDAIKLAFNVVVEVKEQSLEIYKLDHLVSLYDLKVKEWGYTGISDQNLENKKALLYGYLIVNKENGLYKIIDLGNTKEIVADKYNSIEFTENTKEFFVTNSLGQVGIINLDGTTKIEPIYESISVLDKKTDLYLIQKDKKYGVIKSGNITIVYPEYDKIGLSTTNNTANSTTTNNQYLLLDEIIPVCKNNKWGAVDKNGNIVLKTEYDALGCNVTTVEVDGIKKAVIPVVAIERCNGIVVKKSEKYGIISVTGEELVPVAVASIYELENVEDEEQKYFMLYNGKELNVIQRLIAANYIEPKKEEIKEDENNTTESNTIATDENNTTESNTIATNEVMQTNTTSNNIVNQN